MTPDEPRATLKTLAQHLDLSVTTVSRALKGDADVKPETIERVKTAAALPLWLASQGWVPARLAGSRTEFRRTSATVD